ncbi:MAG: SdrD B-like domain-containing protein [Bacteroidota bacterium]
MKKFDLTQFLSFDLSLLLTVKIWVMLLLFIGPSGLSLQAQECTSDASALVKWDFNSSTQDCNGIDETRRRFWNPRVPLMTGGNTYCPQVNDGSGRALIFERGFGNTNDFNGAMCIAGFWQNRGNKYFTAPGYDPSSPTYDPDNPSGNIYMSYSFVPGQAGQLTGVSMEFIQSGWRSGQTIAFNRQGMSVTRNGVRIFMGTIDITASNVNNPAAPLVFNFPNTPEFRTDGSTEVVWEIAFAFVERNVRKRSGIDNICILGTQGPAGAEVEATPATCESGGTDGQLTIVGFSDGEKFDFNAGTSYMGMATFADAMVIPADGIIANNLPLETMPTSYTVRIFREDCFIDETVVMPPVFCPFVCDFPSLNIAPEPPTCDNDVRQDDASIVLSGIINADRVGVSPGRTYTGPLYAGAISLNGSSMFVLDQANAGIEGGDCTEFYTIRIYNGVGGIEDQELCFIDRTVAISPVSCDGCQIICAEIVSTDSEEIDPSNNRGQDQACRTDERVDLNLTKTVNPNSGSNCDMNGMDTEFTFTITLTNEGDLTATDITISDVFPVGMIIQEATTSNAGNPLETFSTLEWTVESLAPGDSETLTIVAVFDSPGNFENCVMVSSVSPANDPDTSDDMACASVNVTGVNRPVVTKAFSPVFAQANSPINLQLKLFNNEPEPIALTEDLIDVFPTMPGQMVVAPTPNVVSILPGIVAEPGATQFLIPAGSVLQPGLTSVSLDVIVPANGDYTNLILPNDLLTTACGNPDTALAELFVSDDNVIAPIVSKFFDKEVMGVGQTAILTVIIENRNAQDISLAGDFADIMPEGIEVTGMPTSDCGGASTFGLDDRVGLLAGTVISGNSICTLQVEVTAMSAGLKCNQIPFNSVGVTVLFTTNPAMTSNEDIAESCIEVVNDPIFDLALRKQLAPMQEETVEAGGSVSFAITIFNQGTTPATNIQVTDYFPSDLTLIDDATWELSGGNAILENPISTLAPGEETVLIIQFDIDPAFTGESIVNSAEISSANGGTDIDSSPDSDPTNDKGGMVRSPSDNVILGNAFLSGGAPGDENGLTDEDDADPAIVFLSILPEDLNCTLVLSADPGDCDPNDGTYDLTGSITFSNPPMTGDLTISLDGTIIETLSSFTSPQPFTLSSLPSDGLMHTVSVAFTDDPACNASLDYTAPDNCADAGTCVVALTAEAGDCDPATNSYALSGEITFTDAPTTGSVTVSVGPFTSTYSAPFSSPLDYQITGLNSDGSSQTVSVTFSENTACTNTADFVAPAGCLPNECSLELTAEAGPCNTSTNLFSITGTLSVTNAPATGTLVVSTAGASVSFPVNAIPANYTLSDLISDGTDRTVTAVFSDDAGCRAEIDLTAPEGCSDPNPACAISLDLEPSPCVGGDYSVSGTITFVDPPATGNIVVSDVSDPGTPLLTIALPTDSPLNFTLPGLEADGATETLTATFSEDGTCSNSASFTAPAACDPTNDVCDLMASATEVTCNDNGTEQDENDDYITFKLNPTGTGLGVSYSVTANVGQVFTTSGSPASSIPYGTETMFRLNNGSIGAGDVTLTLTDDTSPTCTETVVVTDPAMPCSDCTDPTVTLTPMASQCTGTTENNDGTITWTSSTNATHYGISTADAMMYDGPTTTAAATEAPINGMAILTDIPHTGASYIVRIFNEADDCFIEETVTVEAGAVCTPSCGVNIDRVLVSDCYFDSNTGLSTAAVEIEISWQDQDGPALDETATASSSRMDRVRVSIPGQADRFIFQETPIVTETGATVGYQLLSSPQVITFFLPLDGSVTMPTITAQFVDAPAGAALDFSNPGTPRTGCANDTEGFVLPTACDPVPCVTASGVIGGNVYEDYNADGMQGIGETMGLEGVTVRAFVCDANGASILAGTTTTDANGDYFFTGLDDAQTYRLEFESPSSLSNYEPTLGSTEEQTSVQFVMPNNCDVDLGLNNPSNFCESDPNIVLSCYVKGVADNTNSAANDATIVSITYPAAGNNPVGTLNTSYGTHIQTGAVWGIAHEPNENLLFSTAVMRRHVGIGPAGLGGIYVTDLNQPASSLPTSTLMDLTALGFDFGTEPTRSLVTAPTMNSTDGAAFPVVGKIGIGDIDIDIPGQALYLTNLAEKRLYRIDIANYLSTGTLPTAAEVSSFPIPDPGCVGGESRPWATKVTNEGLVYVGVVCDGSTSGSRSDLRAFVYVFNTTTNTFNNTPVLNIPLTYPKGDPDSGPTGRGLGLWNAWEDDIANYINTATFESHPSPILSDIAFDVDGSITLGLIDRSSALQIGSFDNYPDGSFPDGRGEVGIGAGDFLRAQRAGDQFVLENNAQVSGLSGAAPNNSQGPGYGEFYNDNYLGTGGVHTEMGLGGLAIAPGSGQVIATVVDPAQTFNAAGIRILDNTNGSIFADYAVYENGAIDPTNPNTALFNKGGGLGDVEVVCSVQQSIEVGNYVWEDTNGDGVQDPCEPPLEGVTVKLYSKPTSGDPVLLASIETDANGNYYFIGDGEDAATWEITDDTIEEGEQYFIAFCGDNGTTFDVNENTIVVDGVTYCLTVADANEATSSDLNDSDATAQALGTLGTFPAYCTTAGETDETNHTFDVGFKPVVEQVALGNLIYMDNNEDGDFDSGTDMGIDGVTVELYNQGDDPSMETPVATDMTENGGFYLFDELDEGTYFVFIPATNFADNAPLEDKLSVTGADTGDLDDNAASSDNGQDDPTPEANGIRSGDVTLEAGNEPTGESGQDTPAAQASSLPDENVNETVDFTFVEVSCELTITAAPNPCDLADNSYELVVTATYSNPPMGDISITVGSDAPVTFTPSGNSPDMFTISGLDSDGAMGVMVSANFVGDTGCEGMTTYDAPVQCFTPPDPPMPCAGNPGDIGGVAFEDLDNDGVADPVETGQAGIEVMVYDCDGTLVGNTTTGINGEWTVTGLPDEPDDIYRIEFVIPSSLSFLQPSNAGSTNGTNTQFASPTDCEVNFGVIDPGEFCESNPLVIVPCYTNGDPDDSSNNGEPAVIAIEYNDNGEAPTTKMAVNNQEDVGTVHGTAWNSITEELYMASALRRHVGYGPSGPGTIYRQTDLTDASTVSVLYKFDLSLIGPDIPTDAVRFSGPGNGPGLMDDNTDPLTFGLVGKRGLGDIDISNDGNTLYVMNLNDRQVYTLNPNTTNGTSDAVAIPNAPWLDNSICGGGVARPWALEFYEDKIYVGVICDATTSMNCGPTGSCSDLSASVFSYDGTSWATVIQGISLGYTRSFWNIQGGSGPFWHPWVDTWAGMAQYVDFADGNRNGDFVDVQYPQPILTDIEFLPDGTIVLGLGDRTAFQLGYRAPDPDGDPGDISEIYFSGGDILRVGVSPMGGYQIENNGTITNLAGDILSGQNTSSMEGPGGRAFYNDSWGFSIGPNFPVQDSDTGLGGLAQLPSRGEVIFGISDPYFAFGAGYLKFSNMDGSITGGAQVFVDPAIEAGGNNPITPAKGGGLGDLSLDCGTPSIQVGNYVWIDENEDDIQTPCEEPVVGLTVKLYTKPSSGNAELVATTMTGNDGEYYFTGDGTPGETWESGFTELVEGESYFIVFMGDGYDEDNETITVGSSRFELTGADVGEGTNPDLNDSDGAEMNVPGLGNMPVIMFTAEETDHSFDVGLVESEVELVALGNLIYMDNNEDGDFDSGTDMGIDGVTVELYNQGDNPATATPVATDMTENGGFYLFDELDEGTYFVFIPASNFADNAPLEDKLSIPGADTGDLDDDSASSDNGQDDPTPEANGIRSGDVTLEAGNEPTNEGGQDTPVAQASSLPDENVNETVDFTFIAELVALGNFVYMDNNNSGDFEAGIDMPVEGVDLELFEAGENPQMATPVDMTTTDANGFYYFDNLEPGDYFVYIQEENFQMNGALEDKINSNGSADPDDDTTDDDDNGIDNLTPETNGIRSPDITLSPGDEPTDEPGQGGDDGTYPGMLPDENVNETVDFAFFLPVTVGDFTFIDVNMDGQQDGDDLPLPGVEVTIIDIDTGLPVDTDANGEPYTATQTTGMNGDYLFENLPPGNYKVTFDIADADNSEFYIYTDPNSGDDATDSDVDPVNPDDRVGMSDETGFLFGGEEDLTLDAGVVCNILVEVAGPATLCSTQPIDLTQGASISPALLGGTWTSSGDGIFDDGNGEFGVATQYTVGEQDKLNGSVTLTLTSGNPATETGCQAQSASVTFTILKVDCGSFFWDGSND